MALTADSTVVRGKVEATEEQSVDAWLAEAGYQVISIKKASATNFFEGFSLKSNRVSPKELVLFFQQLSALNENCGRLSSPDWQPTCGPWPSCAGCILIELPENTLKITLKPKA